MKLLLLVLSSFVGCAFSSTAGRSGPPYTINDCPADLPRDSSLRQFGNSCYTFHMSDERDFMSAEHVCEQHQGILVTIKNNATQQFLYNTLVHDFHYDSVIWIGLTDLVTESHFMWMDGTPAQFTYWADGQPGMMGGIEDCAAMDVGDGGRWHDYRCQGALFWTVEHIFICEHPIGGLPFTTRTSNPTTTIAATAVSGTSAMCPPFDCSLECGLAGYNTVNGCLVCECQT